MTLSLNCCLCLLEIANCTESLRWHARADIILALELSIDDLSQWSYARQYLVDIICRLEVGPDKTQVGVVTFSDRAYVEFHLNNHTDRSSVDKAIEKINYRPGRGYYNFVAALRKVRNQMFMPVNGARAGACKVLVMVAFCNNNIRLDNLYTLPESLELRSTGVKIIMVGLASRCSRYLLPMMASRPANSSVFWFASPGQISNTTNDVVDGISEMTRNCVLTTTTTTTITTLSIMPVISASKPTTQSTTTTQFTTKPITTRIPVVTTTRPTTTTTSKTITTPATSTTTTTTAETRLRSKRRHKLELFA